MSSHSDSSTPDHNGTIESTNPALDGLSTKSTISEAELLQRDSMNHEIELENIKEPEEEPYLYLDLKGDREEFGSRESVVSAEDEVERAIELQEIEEEEKMENITAEALATHPVVVADERLMPHQPEVDSNTSQLSEEEATALPEKIFEADDMLSDDVITDELEAADRLMPVKPPTSTEKKLPFPIHPKLAVYWHPACVKHYIPDHPEQPGRVKAILIALRNHFQDQVMFRECREADEDIMKLFHTPNHVSSFMKLWEKTNQEWNKRQNVIYERIDGDTRVMWATKSAAFHATGSVLDAIDHVYAETSNPLHIDTAFCCVRPPGHHAERNLSCGFCFFNNAAVGAKYAQQNYGVKKVAVLDFDVHHGNGKDLSPLFYDSRL